MLRYIRNIILSRHSLLILFLLSSGCNINDKEQKHVTISVKPTLFPFIEFIYDPQNNKLMFKPNLSFNIFPIAEVSINGPVYDPFSKKDTATFVFRDNQKGIEKIVYVTPQLDNNTEAVLPQEITEKPIVVDLSDNYNQSIQITSHGKITVKPINDQAMAGIMSSSNQTPIPLKFEYTSIEEFLDRWQAGQGRQPDRTNRSNQYGDRRIIQRYPQNPPFQHPAVHEQWERIQAERQAQLQHLRQQQINRQPFMQQRKIGRSK